MLCTITGVATPTAPVLLAERGLDMASSDGRRLRVVDGDVPGSSRIRRTPALGTHPAQAALADRRADEVRGRQRFARRAPTWPPITRRCAGIAVKPSDRCGGPDILVAYYTSRA